MTISYQETFTKSYNTQRENEVSKIKELLKQGNDVVYSKSDNFVLIDGKIFNGFTKKFIESIKEEIKWVNILKFLNWKRC